MSKDMVDVAYNRDGGVGPIRNTRRKKSGRKSGGGTRHLVPTTAETNMTSSNYMAGHPSLSYFPGTFAHPGLLAPAFTPRPPDEGEDPSAPPLYPPPLTASSYSTTTLANTPQRLSQTVCPQQTQSKKSIDAPSMETHYIPSRILSPIPTMRRSDAHPILTSFPRPPSPPPRSRRRTTSPLAPESLHRPRPNRPRFPRAKIEPSLLRVALMTQLIKRCKASDDYDTIPLKGGEGGVVIMQKLSRSRPTCAEPKYSALPTLPALPSAMLSG